MANNPYQVTRVKTFAPNELEQFLLTGGDGQVICFARTREVAERIAYCLNIVEESEKTDRVA